MQKGYRFLQVLIAICAPSLALAQYEGEASVSRASQSGDNLSVAFAVDISGGCITSSGDIEYTALIERVYSPDESQLITRPGYASWSSENGPDFTVTDNESGFFDDNETFVEISDVDVVTVECEVELLEPNSAEELSGRSTPIFVDAEAALLRSTGIQLSEGSAYRCPINCSGNCSAPPFCIAQRQISDIYLDEILSIEYDYPEAALPLSAVNESIEIANCLSREYPWEETIELTVVERVETRLTTVLRNSRTQKVDFSLDWQIIEALGVNSSVSTTVVTSVDTTDVEATTTTSTIDITRPVSLVVPAMTFVKATATEQRSSIVVPITVTAVFNGDVERINQVTNATYPGVPAGSVWGEPLSIGPLSRFANANERTITLTVEVAVAGGDRELSLRLTEDTLTQDDPRCAEPQTGSAD